MKNKCFWLIILILVSGFIASSLLAKESMPYSNVGLQKISYKIVESKASYRRLRILVTQVGSNNHTYFQTTRDMSYKYQIWFSDHEFSDTTQAILHSQVFVDNIAELSRGDFEESLDTCISDNLPIHRDQHARGVISNKTSVWSCDLSGLIPDTRYWFAIVLVDSRGKQIIPANGKELLTVSAVTSVKDEKPPPPNTSNILMFLVAIIISISLLLMYLRWKDNQDHVKGAQIAHLYVGPALIALALLTFYPIGYGIWMAFTDANQAHLGQEQWVWFENFSRVFSSPGALRVTFFSFVWAGISVLFHVVFGLLFASLLNNQNLKGKAIYRTILLLPWAIPGYISILAWKGMLQTDGLINIILSTDINFLANIVSARVIVVLVSIWLGIPFMMMSLSGAIASIPQDMFEAAKIEGVSQWDQFLHLTLPNLKNTIVPLSLLSFIFTFNSFNTIFLLTRGGPKVGFGQPGATDILITYVYDIAFEFGEYGLAAAWSVIIFLLLAIFSWLYLQKSNATEAVS